MTDWAEIFSLSRPLPETFVRGTVMFLAIYFLLRLVGKREPGAHSLSDLMVVVLIAQAAAPGMGGEASGIGDSVVMILTILGWSLVIDALAYRSPALRRVLKSKASPLIIDGRVNQKALRREFMDHDELLAELRLHGLTDVSQVARAYLEPNGMVSVIRADSEAIDPPQTPTFG